MKEVCLHQIHRPGEIKFIAIGDQEPIRAQYPTHEKVAVVQPSALMRVLPRRERTSLVKFDRFDFYSLILVPNQGEMNTLV